MSRFLRIGILATLAAAVLAIAASTAAAAPHAPVVEIEEDVYTWTDADNGAGPMWCSGSTCLVSCQGRLFATALGDDARGPRH